ncbi:MAG: recombinase family protein [Clostridia bacterium]|nr:recombinase family protein [Clostridia bacterium]
MNNEPLRAGLYMRLSKDDDGAGESSSISNQRLILREYAQSASIPVADEYIDDGYSGTNFDRPDFKRLISDIDSGKINCVIVKDFSRLGRNSAKTAELIDEYFPLKNVRFLSAIDGFDSAEPNKAYSIAAPFLMAANEVYARDISAKIRSAQRAKMIRGDYIASFAPYGYVKSAENKHKLIIDPESAAIVRQIFDLAADGKAPREIARKLNNDGVLTPAEYRCKNRPYLSIEDYSKRREWTSAIVCKMLRNRVYLGELQQGKTTKVSFKSKQSKTNTPDKWIIAKGTHEPIIAEDVFDAVRRRCVSRKSEPNKGFKNIFSGIAVCADCGHNMTTAPSRKKGATYNLCCGAYKAYGSQECTNHFIDYDTLYGVIREDLHRWLNLSEKQKAAIIRKVEKRTRKTQEDKNKAALKAVEQKQRRAEELTILIQRTYEDNAFGRLSNTICDSLLSSYDAELKKVKAEIEVLQNSIQSELYAVEDYRRFFSLMKEVTAPDELTANFLKRLIDRIEIGQGEYVKDESGKRQKRQSIRIYYRFVGLAQDIQ